MWVFQDFKRLIYFFYLHAFYRILVWGQFVYDANLIMTSITSSFDFVYRHRGDAALTLGQ